MNELFIVFLYFMQWIVNYLHKFTYTYLVLFLHAHVSSQANLWILSGNNYCSLANGVIIVAIFHWVIQPTPICTSDTETCSRCSSLVEALQAF